MSEALRVVAGTARLAGPVGGTISVDFSVANHGDIAARFHVRLVEPAAPSGAVFRYPEQPFSLGPGAVMRIKVDVTLPTTTAVDTFEIRLDLVEDGDSVPAPTHGATVTVVVSPTSPVIAAITC